MDNKKNLIVSEKNCPKLTKKIAKFVNNTYKIKSFKGRLIEQKLKKVNLSFNNEVFKYNPLYLNYKKVYNKLLLQIKFKKKLK